MSLTSNEQLRLDPQNLKPGPYVPYMVRRETHSSRAITSVIVAVITLAALIYLVIEGILGLLGKEPLLLSWSAMVNNIVNLPDSMLQPALIITGIVLVLVGLFLLAKAILPGPLGRHSISDKRSAYIIDDAVIASAASRTTREYARLGQGQVSSEIKRRSLTTTVTPTSGIPLEASTIKQVLEPTVKRYNLVPDPKVNVEIRDAGVVNK